MVKKVGSRTTSLMLPGARRNKRLRRRRKLKECKEYTDFKEERLRVRNERNKKNDCDLIRLCRDYAQRGGTGDIKDLNEKKKKK